MRGAGAGLAAEDLSGPMERVLDALPTMERVLYALRTMERGSYALREMERGLTDANPGAPRRGATPLLEARGLTKHYGATIAAEDIDLDVHPGSVHALVGENGAGKSTLIKMLTGLVRPTRGVIRYRQRPLEIRSPHHAMAEGIVAVHQELTLVDTLSVAENVWLGHEPRGRLGTIDFQALRRLTAALAAEVGLGLDPSAPVAELALAQKQLVELLKALSWRPQVLILDEATSSLGDREVDLLARAIATLRDDGRAIVFVSHRLNEIFRLCDHCSVMKDGRIVHEDEVLRLDEQLVVSRMTGRKGAQALFPPRAAPDRPRERVLSIRGLCTQGGLQDVSLDVLGGEIVGLGGLQGQGQVELLECLYGLRRRRAGEIVAGVAALALHRPPEALAAGIVFVPEDRKTQGLFLDRTVEENVVACSHRLVSALGVLVRRRVREVTGRLVAQMDVKVASTGALARSLSGGNQQKVALGRWLGSSFRIIVLVEPTRGIDINTKVEIYRLLRQLADRGVAVVLSTNDLLELVGLCDRVAVMFEKRIAAVLQGADLTQHAILEASFGYRRGAA